MDHMDHEADVFREHQRLVILRTLNDAPQRAVHQSLLLDLMSPYGIEDPEILLEHLDWLAERFLVVLAEVKGKKVAEITDRGASVAEGRRRHEGIRSPTRQRLSAAALEAAIKLGARSSETE